MKMRNFIIWVVGVMFISFGIGMTIINNSNIRSNVTGVQDSKAYKVDGINNIKIKTTSEGISINRIDDNAISANISGQTLSKSSGIEIKMEQTGDTLYVSVYRQRAFFLFANTSPLQVYLPRSYDQNLTIETVSGSIKSDDLSNIQSVSAKTVSGRIDLEKINNKIKTTTTSGATILSVLSVQNDINIDSVSGRVRLDIPKDANYKLKFNTVSGAFENNTENKFNKIDRGNYEGLVNNGANLINIKTTSGKLEIE